MLFLIFRWMYNVTMSGVHVEIDLASIDCILRGCIKDQYEMNKCFWTVNHAELLCFSEHNRSSLSFLKIIQFFMWISDDSDHFTLCCKLPQYKLEVTVWWSQQNSIICIIQRNNPEVPEPDTFIPFAAPCNSVHEGHDWNLWQGKTLAERNTHPPNFLFAKDTDTVCTPVIKALSKSTKHILWSPCMDKELVHYSILPGNCDFGILIINTN